MAEPVRPAYGHRRDQSSLATATLSQEKSKGDADARFSDPSTQNMTGSQDSLAASSTGTRFTGGLSIDQSVRAFKTFELLRTGGDDNVKQALQESSSLKGTTVLHLAVQGASPSTVDQIIKSGFDIDAQDKDGNTPLHLAANLGRLALVRLFLDHKADSSTLNYQGKSALDLARTPEIFQALQLEKAMLTEVQVAKIHGLVAQGDYDGLEMLLESSHVNKIVDVDAMELASEPSTVESGGTLLHEAARKKDIKLIQLLLLNGADPFRRDKKGRLPKDVTKDDRTRAILKKSPAATAAQRGVQEKSILGTHPATEKPMGRESREIKGYLKKWTNYTSGYKLRWFVLEDGVLSYYKNQDDAGSACRGAMNMKIAKLAMDTQDKTRFEIVGKSSVKYHLKANHEVEAKRWFWALNNAIQWAKDEARQGEQRALKEADAQRQAISDQRTRETTISESRKMSTDTSFIDHEQTAGSIKTLPSILQKTSIHHFGPASGSVAGEEVSVVDSHEPFQITKDHTIAHTDGDIDDEDASILEAARESKDALAITTQSASLQLEILQQISQALETRIAQEPNMPISHTDVKQAISTYASAVQSLQSMLAALQRITQDRDANWQYKLDREMDIRKMWEESMAKVVQDQEQLEGKIGESEEKRRRTKRALREVLEVAPADLLPATDQEDSEEALLARKKSFAANRRGTVTTLAELSDSDSDLDEEEFFDAVGAGQVPVEEMAPLPSYKDTEIQNLQPLQLREKDPFAASFIGYEDPVRQRLRLDADDRPKISLWGILKSMIGKDMTKMTLPVSFNEPTSLLQRVAEDMEYTDLLDIAVDRADSTERMIYVAAFAASEYASTIGRVAKPFNPLLGETYEYARPDKGYRFFVEQVSHHPPVGAAWADSKRWSYYGESAVKSKFYGRAFDINPLGTWFLRLRPASGGEELYTWKKVTTSVIGIMTGSPTVDNYGIMEIKNWNTGEVCTLDFKARGWKASSAYQVLGKVVDAEGRTRWSIGGRWNDKIFARLTPGYEAENLEAVTSSEKAFLVWQAHTRPTGIPFNLTPFGVTLNALPDKLRPCLPQTDTRLRPDQRAMEDGEYDLAAAEKNRLEEKQRAKRRLKEAEGTVHVPRWFQKVKCETTGEEYWKADGSYWQTREEASTGGEWTDVDDIF